MRRANCIQAVVATLLVCSLAGKTLADTTVYLVRHAEKAVGGRDPELSAEGAKRAAELARVLRSAGIDECFATQFKRTRLTVEPVAKSIGKEVQVEKAGTEKRLIIKIRNELDNQQVLIAGHSNTVPLMLKHLGIHNPPKLGESDYDDLFIVTVSSAGLTAYQHLHYGAENPKE
ncbi:MAG: phosphoglycerate mutase family protein [Aureliella sp.]